MGSSIIPSGPYNLSHLLVDQNSFSDSFPIVGKKSAFDNYTTHSLESDGQIMGIDEFFFIKKGGYK